jgi:hypothetical protein
MTQGLRAINVATTVESNQMTFELFGSDEFSVQHMPLENYIRDSNGFSGGGLLFFREQPASAYEICIRTEEKMGNAFAMCKQAILDAEKVIKGKDEVIKMKDEVIQDLHRMLEMDTSTSSSLMVIKVKDAVIKAKDEVIQEVIKGKDEVIKAKNEVIQALKEKSSAEHQDLSGQLARSNTENLMLAHSLSVRGMIEKVEMQYSELKRSKDSASASRRGIWTEILRENSEINTAVSRACSGKNSAAKTTAAIQVMLDIYQKASREVHSLGYDVIPIRKDVYHGSELDVLQGLCGATHYEFKVI